MKITKKQLLDFNQAFNVLSSTVQSKVLVYSLLKNSKLIADEAEALNKAFETDSEEYKDYIQKTQELSQKYGDKDETGELKLTENKMGVIVSDPENKKNLTEEIKKLDEDYKDALEARNKELEKYNELLSEEIEIDFNKIKLKDLPDTLTNDAKFAVSVLIDLIEE